MAKGQLKRLMQQVVRDAILAGYSERQLAIKSGNCSQSTISRFLDEHTTFNIATADALLDFLGVKVTYDPQTIRRIG